MPHIKMIKLNFLEKLRTVSPGAANSQVFNHFVLQMRKLRARENAGNVVVYGNARAWVF